MKAKHKILVTKGMLKVGLEDFPPGLDWHKTKIPSKFIQISLFIVPFFINSMSVANQTANITDIGIANNMTKYEESKFMDQNDLNDMSMKR